MTSFDLSQSYNITHNDSFNTFQLFTQQKALSLIHELNSDTSSSVSPKILFSSQLQKQFKTVRQIDYSNINQASQTRVAHHLDSLMGGQSLATSIQVFEHAEGFHTLEGQTLGSQQIHNELNIPVIYSPIKHSEGQVLTRKVPMHFTKSRNITIPLTIEETQHLSSMDYFEQQFSKLKENMKILTNTIDRLSTNQKSDSQERGYESPQRFKAPLNRLLNYDMQTIKDRKVKPLEAKSTESQEVSTPRRHKSPVRPFGIEDLSPILEFSVKEPQSNIDERSSSTLMKKKFSKAREINTA